MKTVDLRLADRLRSRGWTVQAPVDRTGCPNESSPVCCSDVGKCVILNPCALRCVDPEMHAEGGHDV